MKSVPTSEFFDLIGNMEEPLAIISDLTEAIAMIAETIEDEGRPVQRLAWMAKEQMLKAEKLRGDLFRLTHPNRDHFEREEWPA